MPLFLLQASSEGKENVGMSGRRWNPGGVRRPGGRCTGGMVGMTGMVNVWGGGLRGPADSLATSIFIGSVLYSLPL